MNETAITIDHETGRVRVDTTLKRYRHQLEKAGFKEITACHKASLNGHSSWEGGQIQMARTLFRKGPSESRRKQGLARCGFQRNHDGSDNERAEGGK